MENREAVKSPQIVYNCYYTRSREGEQFIPEHILSYQIAGTLVMNDGNKEYVFNEGAIRFCKRNHLVKFNKTPPDNGEFKSLSLYLDQETLRNFSLEYGIEPEGNKNDDAVLNLNYNPLYQSYMNSLMPYLQGSESIPASLQALKLKEAILIILQANPELKNVLFDFAEPGKIDLEGFMNKNFHFNVELKRFAYLTGRSLATFKRDFEKIFHSSPSRWLLHRRLQEAYFLIKEKGKAPSDVYLELGFEDLSHFSFAFKKAYGMAPSKI
ncbi:helix-turn-helix domain-containing protein [Larkinella terrae]|uniref:Helix-turn-helix domain-containing protein n=1 Tax=Larkinella terrae TaxID=2025311 RepID=A0A7K0EM94_9BACT|nr:AraC family transcriptional regulator [Larkinella terrae]MRS62832.1 helix-turn-helix domain-containing protein [Larkinella terrae]